MKKLKVKYCSPRVTREFLSNPFAMNTLTERLQKSGARSLSNNLKYRDLGNGYFEIKSKGKK
jgi:hypothetical protein